MSESVEVPVTRQAPVTLIGRVRIEGAQLLMVIEPAQASPTLDDGDTIMLRQCPIPGSHWRAGSLRVHAIPGGPFIDICGPVTDGIPAACDGDWAYLVERQP